METSLQILENKMKDYSVLQFEQHRILLQNKKTKTKYLYKQINLNPVFAATFLEGLKQRASMNDSIKSLILMDYCSGQDKVGLLSEYSVSDIHKQLQNRVRSNSPRSGRLPAQIRFTEDELINTFTPVIECLLEIHGTGEVHGHLRAKNIVITENEEMKLCDAFLLGQDTECESIFKDAYYAPEYPNTLQLTPQNDLWSLGLVLLECAALQPSEQFYHRTSKKIDQNRLGTKIANIAYHYSDEFIIALKLLLSEDPQARLKAIEPLISKKLPTDLPAEAIQRMRPDRSPPKSPVIVKVHERLSESESPVRSSHRTITTRPRVQKLDKSDFSIVPMEVGDPKDSQIQQKLTIGRENMPEKGRIEVFKEKFKMKMQEDSELKKKQIEKINRIIEKSNAFVSELIAKKADKNFSRMPSLNKATAANTPLVSAVNYNENSGVKKEESFAISRKKDNSSIMSFKDSPTKTLVKDRLRSLSRKK